MQLWQLVTKLAADTPRRKMYGQADDRASKLSQRFRHALWEPLYASVSASQMGTPSRGEVFPLFI